MTSSVSGVSSLTRVQQRFAASGLNGLDDGEAIELVLSLCLTPQESSRLAQACISKFHSLAAFMSASPQEMERAGITYPARSCIDLLRRLPSGLPGQDTTDRPAYTSSRDVFDYLHVSMRRPDKEVFKVLHVDNRNRIIEIADLPVQPGTGRPVRPREVMESALSAGAARLLLAHNHPPGDPAPSRQDKRLTRQLVFAGILMRVRVLDHIVIGADRYFSFADEGLLRKYEDDFLDMEMRLHRASDG